MDYIKDTFSRMDLHHIQQFLLYGAEDYVTDTRPYAERLKAESNAIYRRLENLYPDRTELDEAAADLSQALTAYETVYMEIGMKAGARLIFQLLLADDLPAEKE